MRNKLFSLAGLLLLGSGSLVAQEQQLWYRQPAVKWTEALPLGNGRIGAMVFGGVKQDRIQFNEETLWTGEPRSYNRPGAYRYLDTIRQLIFNGQQKAAEALAEKQFMGLKSNEGKREEWLKSVLSTNAPAAASFDDQTWKTMQVPSFDGWEAVGHEGLDGAVWLRTSFELPAAWSGKDLILDLNRIRDYDRTFVNGELIGTQDNTEARLYKIPAAKLRAGRNIIAIQVLNFADKGGVTGYKDTTRHIGVYPDGQASSILSLNGQWRYWVQQDEPPAVGRYQADYQPFGDLFMEFKHNGEATNYRRQLDLPTATATTSYTADGTDFTREYLVSQPNQALLVHLAASRKGQINSALRLTSPHKNYQVRKLDNNTLALSVKVRHGALRGESYLRVQVKGGKVQVFADRVEITNADEADVALTAGTNYRNYRDVSANPATACVNTLKGLTGKAYAQLKAAHLQEYAKYYNTFAVNFGVSANEHLPTDERIIKFGTFSDAPFMALYMQYARYLLIASSRPGTRPANLQGIWNDLLSPPWGSKYTTNINLEMNYWPAELLNLSLLHQPLFDMIDELTVTGKETAKAYYNAPGWVLHHNTDLWRGTAPINAANHGIWVTGGAWLCQHLWEHYLFTQDRQFLKTRGYPAMKQAALFFLSFLTKDPQTGWLISVPSNSPEQGGLVAGPAMDHQIIRQLFKNVIAASEVLKVDAALRDTLALRYKQIAPDQVGKHGQLQEWIKDVDDPKNKHRHVSHLWAVYPGSEINFDERPELVNAAMQSLLFRGDAATGWSLAWKINFWARFREGEHTYKMVQMLLSPASSGAGSYPNLFDAHPPFQIDGNFGGGAGMAEMLLQSHTNYVDILPALPSAVPEGDIRGLCARGGFEINMRWKSGELTYLRVLSKAGQPLALRYREKVVNLATVKNGVYEFNNILQKL
ncbi:glycoside hydrolase N-terminal domain-containing protein [Chitinophaga horti]|uniref:Glycoside hydrolase N-terminal domain-containing protein n=1 Tax=Chitinophaga horti TaxID=2920382 RepID=A0ABY6J794_9BACT|nr:glycoside hydrolase N-terminal domain-containing protein [Chitinophaga horti]UYQ95555.1 glycoside hydrolase N-terminal domain-containing protein [Chitinophaga horti]